MIDALVAWQESGNFGCRFGRDSAAAPLRRGRFFFRPNEETRDFLEVESDQGRCADPALWPAEGPYTIGQAEAGRIMCTDTAMGASIIWWTDELLNIKSVAISTDGDKEALYEFWANESGPERP